CSGRAAREKDGRFPLVVSAISVNCETTRAEPPVSSSDRSNLPSSFSKIRNLATFPARRSAAASTSPSATPSSTHRPARMEPPGVAEARATRWTTALIGVSLEVEDPRGVRLGSRLHRARQFVVPVRLGRPALVLERTPEGVVRVVVGGRQLLDDRAELALGVLPPREAEVGDAEGLADRCLLGLEPLRLLERDRRLRGHSLAEPLLSLTEEVVRVAHGLLVEPTFMPGTGSSRAPGQRAS